MTFIPIRYSRFLLLFILSSIFTGCDRQNSSCNTTLTSELYNPAVELRELFVDVQLSGIFADSKTFPDCKLLLPADSILTLYRKAKDSPGFRLDSFVLVYFQKPDSNTFITLSSANETLDEHILSLWDKLKHEPDSLDSKTSKIPISYAYIVPGGRFREIYYWDSYFTMIGLTISGKEELIDNMVSGFECLINQFGYIPNGSRSYYLGRSQPPFFAEMVRLIMESKGERAAIKYIDALEMEYAFWMAADGNRAIPIRGGTMNRYWDEQALPRPEAYREDVNLALRLPPEAREDFYRNVRAACESGWDFSSRWLLDSNSIITIRTTEILPIDLNCLLYNLENILSRLYDLTQHTKAGKLFEEKASLRAKLIQELFWNEEGFFFYDYDFTRNKSTGIATLASLYPLYFRVATDRQARLIALRLEKEFLYSGGLVTTLNNTGQQWDAPNGWAPLQWMAVKGLENYGFHELAAKIARQWMALNERVYYSTGKMMEKYNVQDTTLLAGGGEYPSQDGFGWTNGVYQGFKLHYPATKFER